MQGEQHAALEGPLDNLDSTKVFPLCRVRPRMKIRFVVDFQCTNGTALPAEVPPCHPASESAIKNYLRTVVMNCFQQWKIKL